MARNIRRFRLERGLSQRDVARELGSGSPYISHLESGKAYSPSLGFLRRLASVLGVSVGVLLGEVESPPTVEARAMEALHFAAEQVAGVPVPVRNADIVARVPGGWVEEESAPFAWLVTDDRLINRGIVRGDIVLLAPREVAPTYSVALADGVLGIVARDSSGVRLVDGFGATLSRGRDIEGVMLCRFSQPDGG